MGDVEQRADAGGELRRTLLAAAEQLLSETGVARLSLREVSRRAQVSHNAPYHHFQSKGELLSALATDGFLRLHESLEASSAGPPEARLVDFGRRYVEFSQSHPELFRLMFRPEWTTPAAHPELRAASARSWNLLQELMRQWDRESPAAPQSSALAALLAWGAVHGCSQLALDGPFEIAALPGAPLPDVAERMLRLLIDALRPTDEN